MNTLPVINIILPNDLPQVNAIHAMLSYWVEPIKAQMAPKLYKQPLFVKHNQIATHTSNTNLNN